MRADRKNNVVLILAAFAAFSLLTGCQIPGGSFGHEPLQTRFAELTRNAIKAEAEPEPTNRYEPSPRVTAAEPVVLAGGTKARNSL